MTRASRFVTVRPSGANIFAGALTGVVSTARWAQGFASHHPPVERSVSSSATSLSATGEPQPVE
jgi:hypothetical protein